MLVFVKFNLNPKRCNEHLTLYFKSNVIKIGYFFLIFEYFVTLVQFKLVFK